MLNPWVVVTISVAYVGLLFAIAYYGDKSADRGRSIIANPYIYALSLGVYATAWTFYGSVGRAAADGVGFLPIYIGPTLMIALWWVVMRKIVRISKAQRITSLADFISSRYGKSALLAGLVTVIAVIGVVPYIALQLKAVSTSFAIVSSVAGSAVPTSPAFPVHADTAFWLALLLATFTILFGTRHLDATERHEGLVAAVAFESLVKLVAFVAVGIFVTYGIYAGLPDLFHRAAEEPRLARLFAPAAGPAGSYANWAWLTILSMLAIMLLPRQFQIAVVENVDERHLRTAIWLFPLYMLAMNVFVVPIAFGGMLHFGDGAVDPDTFVLTLPLAAKQNALALLVFIGGLSAATGMVIVETIALSTMVCNDLVMPVLLRIRVLRVASRPNLGAWLLAIRRAAIVAVVLLGYAYYRFAGEVYALVAIGLVSFAAVAQFAPAMLGGLFWRGATRAGALAGLLTGFSLWLYTLLLPSFAKSGWLPASFVAEGPWAITLLKPYALFGLTGLQEITHAMLWTMTGNIATFVLVSLLTRQSTSERAQAARFVDALSHDAEGLAGPLWRGTAALSELHDLLRRFLGVERADAALAAYARRRGLEPDAVPADAALVHFVETSLAGAIGAASARIVLASAVQEDAPTIEEVRTMLDEASHVIAYSHELKQKSEELVALTAELRAANERLKELDRLKDDFVSTITHELRTPLTSIRAFSEILHDNAQLDAIQRQHFLSIIIQESERLTRLINQVLDLSKLESGRAEWQVAQVNSTREVILDSIDTTAHLFRAGAVHVESRLPDDVPMVLADRDRLIQVLINLLSNAAKFVPAATGRVLVELTCHGNDVRVAVTDNGPGISANDQRMIFEKFVQAGNTLTDRPRGTGLGLPISRHIIEHFGGRLWVRSVAGEGATFAFDLPVVHAPARPDAMTVA